ncbi:MAG: hemerythrin domain-containing protein [Deltaproteobacteria bacterium]|nr:hemerythrin domain-containing protein [Deltaproteobacteria bacterium]
MARRHPSLVPLSRDHRDALALAFRLKHPSPPGPATAVTPPSTPEGRARETLDFFAAHLAGHFRAEEDVLFPAIVASPAADVACRSLVEQLVAEHRTMERGRDSIAAALASGSGLADALATLADTLECHVRREERELFVRFDGIVAEPAAGGLLRPIEVILGARRRACALPGARGA